jgi:hypothetical protein
MRTAMNQRIDNSALIPQHLVLSFALCAMFFALCASAEAQQPKKTRGSDICRELVIPPILGKTSRHSDEGYKSSVI